MPTALALLRTPRWIGLTALAVVVAALCVLGGKWQWTRTQDILALERAALAEPVAVQDVAPVGEPLAVEAIGRPVVVSGRYAADRQAYVTSRSLDGRAGLWVVAPVELGDGTQVAVLRGWVPEERAAEDAPPDGAVVVRGILQPGESFYEAAPVDDGRLTAITDAALAQLWGEGVRTGVVVLAEQSPPSQGGPRPVPPTVGAADVPFPLQNFFYAFQWWFFAAFVGFVWTRWFLLDLRDARRAGTADEARAEPG